jgi:multiple antibiotic resistance protein
MLKPFFLAFTGIFVALDIVGATPMYLAMTRGLSRRQRNRIVDLSMGVALVVALLFLAAGQAIFRWLGITIFDFKIAGGIVLLLISLADLVGGPEAKQQPSGSTGVVPLAVPLITGPGVLTTLVLQVPVFGFLVTGAALVVNYALGWYVLRRSETLTRWIGKDGTVVISKIASLLLAAIAVAMIRNGAFEAIRAFAKGP